MMPLVLSHPLVLPHPLDIPSPPRGVWDLGPIPLRAYALFIIAGIVVAAIWGGRRLVARGGRPGRILDLAVWMVPFGLVGGRLYHVITDPELYFGDPAIPGHNWNPWGALAIWNGGLGIWGAIALGALGAYLGCRRYKISFGAVADALAPGIVMAQAIGRLGNYFNQELFGSPTTLPWALDVYLRTPGGLPDAAVSCAAYGGEFPTTWIQTSPTVLCGTYHPTFLYELLWDVGVALLVVWADRRFRLGHGRAFALYVAGYTAGRAWVEMLRIDHANHILGLRLNVFVAAAVFLAAVIYLIATHRLGREDPATVWGIDPRARAAGGAGDRAGPGSAGDRAPGDDVGDGAGGEGAVGEGPSGDGAAGVGVPDSGSADRAGDGAGDLSDGDDAGGGAGPVDAGDAPDGSDSQDAGADAGAGAGRPGSDDSKVTTPRPE